MLFQSFHGRLPAYSKLEKERKEDESCSTRLVRRGEKLNLLLRIWNGLPAYIRKGIKKDYELERGILDLWTNIDKTGTSKEFTSLL